MLVELSKTRVKSKVNKSSKSLHALSIASPIINCKVYGEVSGTTFCFCVINSVVVPLVITNLYSGSSVLKKPILFPLLSVFAI